MVYQKKRRCLQALVATVLLSSCAEAVAPPAWPPQPSYRVPVTFTILIPSEKKESVDKTALHRTHFIPQSTQSVTIATDGRVLTVADVSAVAPGCHATARSARICAIRAYAPSGKQMFTVTAFDRSGGLGSALASGNIQALLSPGSPARFMLSLSGVPASIAISLSAAFPPAGTPAAEEVIVSVLDADGNRIIGDYGKDVELGDSDATATQLSQSTITDSSTRVALNYGGASLMRAIITAKIAGLQTSSVAFAPSPTTVAQYVAAKLPGPNGPLPASFGDLCLGPDGNIWLTATTGAIEKVDDGGRFTPYLLFGATPEGISVGADGNMWFAEEQVGKIGRITTNGVITSFALPAPQGGSSNPTDTTPGPDGRTWFVDQGTGTVGYGAVTSSGKIAKYRLPSASTPQAIVAGPDGNLWITDLGLNAIDVVSTSGRMIASHRLPSPNAQPWGMTIGPDRNVWFAEFKANRIGRMTMSGGLKEYLVPSQGAGPLNVAAGPEGNVWFTESGSGFWDPEGKLGYVTPRGIIRDFPSGHGIVAPVHDLAFDLKGTLWSTNVYEAFSALEKTAY